MYTLLTTARTAAFALALAAAACEGAPAPRGERAAAEPDAAEAIQALERQRAGPALVAPAGPAADGTGAADASFDSGGWNGGDAAPFVEPDIDWVDDPHAVVSEVGEYLDPDREEVPGDGPLAPVTEVGEFIDPDAG